MLGSYADVPIPLWGKKRHYWCLVLRPGNDLNQHPRLRDPLMPSTGRRWKCLKLIANAHKDSELHVEFFRHHPKHLEHLQVWLVFKGDT